MVYPGRASYPEPLERFRGTATPRQTAEQRADFIQFVASEYQAGRSLRELAGLTDRTQTAVRRGLAEAGVQTRGRGAPKVDRH
ncbi:helix-turn-helix domain-containing protein [Ornithinimicrobium cavernae]|uniref:helix-turn-helix domain-containing protein n=1 Tax=Ornithinimicrobium cavernae TaxID=2666047 RepID=UPI000D69E012